MILLMVLVTKYSVRMSNKSLTMATNAGRHPFNIIFVDFKVWTSSIIKCSYVIY